MERLDKFLCDSGAGTRSQVKIILKAGRVTVDGKPEKDPGKKIDPKRQQVLLDGQPLGGMRRVVLMMNKPEGFVTATEDPVEKTVMELLPETYRHLELKPVGRLDKATEGLLLFTNDGDLLHRLISPKKEVPKVYYARHEGQAGPEAVTAFAQGLTLRPGAPGCRGKPDHRPGGKIPSGAPDDGIPGHDRTVPGAQKRGGSYPGRSAPGCLPGADGRGDSGPGSMEGFTQ